MKKFFAQTYLWLLLTMLYAPIVIIAIFSFTEAKVETNIFSVCAPRLTLSSQFKSA